MKATTKWYWEQKYPQQVIAVPTGTIVHPCIKVFAVNYVQYIPRIVCNRNQSQQALYGHPICITDSYYE